ncbi:MAG TPA: ATP-binding protein [Acidobacteriota bacterium]|nr:ATP-binding protein [Acidobacteriota bacterium]HNT18660.1 ATP-binding protein [Acidobacteriota bacterium]
MIYPPPYFESIRQRSLQRWKQLESDPELAAPWRQLFNQVQSPRHVLSELLQNADDAGATEASVQIDNKVFAFEHNGEDFTEEHFTSLCRFGYSNKRALHTIGFRGIGFKSTFSLGNNVVVFTPTLSVSFNKNRFTLPEWSPAWRDTSGKTIIWVEISDYERQQEVEKNLYEWHKSPVSLLFFKNIRSLKIQGSEISWRSQGKGPIDKSEWMALNLMHEEPFLVVRSEEEAFPEEALQEIRQERLLGTGEETSFPPCKVEIVLNAQGRLYVVLPTGVSTDLPFACNAPFIQDPARERIKSPETSPTNRWLLKRTGLLAAYAMLDWLGKTTLSTKERAKAYGLLPDPPKEDGALENICSTAVKNAFTRWTTSSSLLLAEDGMLISVNNCIYIPKHILDIWSAKQASAFLDDRCRPVLCQHVESADRGKLLRWKFIEEVGLRNLLDVLQRKHVHKPDTWQQLVKLWSYIAPEVYSFRSKVNTDWLKIIPVTHSEFLYPPNEVVRLGEKKTLHSKEDWDLLSEHLKVLDQDWLNFLSEHRRLHTGETDHSVEDAIKILDKVGLNDVSDVTKVIEQAAKNFFSNEEINADTCIQLAQIAAKLDAQTGKSFCYYTRNEDIKSIESGVLFDVDGSLETILPEDKKGSLLLHYDYMHEFKSCSREEWLQWISNGRSGLKGFVPTSLQPKYAYNTQQLKALLHDQGYSGSFVSHYVRPKFIFNDWDFDPCLWDHWKKTAEEDPQIWKMIVAKMLYAGRLLWADKSTIIVREENKTGGVKDVKLEKLILATWVRRFRELPCLPDTRGFLHKPSELFRRTPETESLIDVEPFVNGGWDHSASRELLDILGVQSTPTGPEKIIQRVIALSQSDCPPLEEVDKWYRRLDKLADSCSTEDLDKIIGAFRWQRLILSHKNEWMAINSVFISSNEEDVPDAEVIRHSVNNLSLWRKIGVAERPTVELALEWLKDLTSSEKVVEGDLKRVRGVLGRHPKQVWDGLGHWLNLEGEWVPVKDLAYSLTMQTLIAWKNLHPEVKRKTADFQNLSAEIGGAPPFSSLPRLSTLIEERLSQDVEKTNQVGQEWILTLGHELGRVKLETDEATQQLREHASVLAETAMFETGTLEILPYINGKPAGLPRKADVAWIGTELLVSKMTKGKLAKRVPEEIGKVFDRYDIKAALHYSFERRPEEIREYMKANFSLVSTEEAALSAVKPPVAIEDSSNPVEEIPARIAPEQNGVQQEEEEIIEESVNQSDFDDEGAPKHKKKPRFSMIEIFAKLNGFKNDGGDRYFHPDGDWLGKVSGSLFPWELRNRSGDLLRSFLPLRHCLENEPIEIGADVWGLMQNEPEQYSLLLMGPKDDPVEVRGAKLQKMLDDGEIKLFPAKYRLAIERNGR